MTSDVTYKYNSHAIKFHHIRVIYGILQSFILVKVFDDRQFLYFSTCLVTENINAFFAGLCLCYC
jgi:hypothetical protein